MAVAKLNFHLGVPGWLSGKKSTCNSEDSRDAIWIPSLGISPAGGNGNPLQYSCQGNPMERSLVGYSPWSHKELDTTNHTPTIFIDGVYL